MKWLKMKASNHQLKMKKYLSMAAVMSMAAGENGGNIQ